MKKKTFSQTTSRYSTTHQCVFMFQELLLLLWRCFLYLILLTKQLTPDIWIGVSSIFQKLVFLLFSPLPFFTFHQHSKAITKPGVFETFRTYYNNDNGECFRLHSRLPFERKAAYIQMHFFLLKQTGLC